MLLLVRHGESAGNVAGLLLGRTESDLTSRGWRQAEAVATSLKTTGTGGFVGTDGSVGTISTIAGVARGRIVRVVSSPLGRARQTAEVVAKVCHVDDVKVDPRWMELDYGDLDGQPISDVSEALWERWRQDPDLVPARGESLAALGRRVRQALTELVGSDPAGSFFGAQAHVVVVSHVSPIKAAVAWALGVGDEICWRTFLATASITVIGAGRAGPSLRGFNLTAA